MARTTITIDDDLLRDAKRQAAHERTTLSALTARALRTVVAHGDAGTTSRSRPAVPRVWDGGDGFLHGSELGSIGTILGALDEMELTDSASEDREPRFR